MSGAGATFLDPDVLRSQMPGVGDRTYLNNAAASLMSTATLSAIHQHLHLEAVHGSYLAEQRAESTLDGGYEIAARLLGCSAGEIAFTDGCSRGWQAVVGAVALRPGDVILTSATEWGGNYGALLLAAKRSGASVKVVSSREDGTICVKSLAGCIDGRVRLIALTWVPSGSGIVNAAAEVGAVARHAGVPFILDAAQAVGQIPTNVRALGCDALAAPGRKWLRGPRGTGLLYVKAEFAEALVPATSDYLSAAITPAGLEWRDGARKFESAERSAALRLGLISAIEEHLAVGTEAMQERIGALAEYARSRLADMPGLRVLEIGKDLSGILTLVSDRETATELRDRLAAADIDVAVIGRRFTPIAFANAGLNDVLRVSPHAFNTFAEIDRLADALGDGSPASHYPAS